MRETKIRFGLQAWLLIQEEARRDGISASQYVREAAIARALMDRTQNDPEFVKQYASVIGRLRGD